MVGIAIETLTSCLFINSIRFLALTFEPGKTNFAPIIDEAYVTPHAFTWNIGVIGNIQSLELSEK